MTTATMSKTMADPTTYDPRRSRDRERLGRMILDALEASGFKEMPPGDQTRAMNNPKLIEPLDEHFAGETLRDILNSLAHADTDFAGGALAATGGNSPLSMACTVELIHRVRGLDTIEDALEQEYRFTSRALERGDFIEGIRAAIVDKDRAPKWKHADPAEVSRLEVMRMLSPLGQDALQWEET